MRILAVLHRSEVGGTEVCYGRLLERLSGLDRVEILGAYPAGPLTAEWEQRAPWVPYRAGKLPIIRSRREYLTWALDGLLHTGELVRTIREWRPDVVLSLTSVLTAPTHAARVTGVPSVSYVREFVEPPAVRDRLWGYLGSRCDALIPVSTALQRAVEPYAPGKIHLVPDGVPVPERRDRDRGDRPVVAFFGGFEPLKGGDVFVDALDRVGDPAGAVFRYYGVAAPGQEVFEARVRDRAGRSSVPVEFVPTREILDAQAAASIVVMPSRQEGLGLVALEAMAHGVPVVVSRTGGLADVVEHDVSGLLVPPEDAGALGVAIGRLLRDEPLRARMGQAARERVEQKFSIGSATDGLLGVLEDVARRRRAT